MISKKAEKFLKENKIRSPYPTGDFYMGDVYKAIDIAEDEMIEKAVQVFSESCEMYAIDGICLENGRCDSCSRVYEFKQKLMEG